MSDHIHENLNDDGVDRRGFLKCMAWAGTGLVFAMSGGIARSRMLLAPASDQGGAAGADFTFVQISDSHIGFNKDANNNVIGTLQEAINRIKALPTKPDLIIHTGDLSHLAEADEFDTVAQALKGTGVSDIFYVPGEHDVLNDNGEQYRNRFAKGTNGDGWYSFTHRGVHFVGLVNVMGKSEAGLGSLGQDQLSWLEQQAPALKDALKWVNVATQTVGVFPPAKQIELRNGLASGGLPLGLRLERRHHAGQERPRDPA